MNTEQPEYTLFPVPTDRIPDVARYLYGSAEAMPEAAEALSEPPAPMSADQRRDLLGRVYMESEPPFRRLLMLLAESQHPETQTSFTDISAAMGWTSPRSLPGALGAYGRRTKHRYGGFWPFERHWDATAWSHFMSMDAGDAAVLRDLHSKSKLPTT